MAKRSFTPISWEILDDDSIPDRIKVAYMRILRTHQERRIPAGEPLLVHSSVACSWFGCHDTRTAYRLLREMSSGKFSDNPSDIPSVILSDIISAKPRGKNFAIRLNKSLVTNMNLGHRSALIRPSKVAEQRAESREEKNLVSRRSAPTPKKRVSTVKEPDGYAEAWKMLKACNDLFRARGAKTGFPGREAARRAAPACAGLSDEALTARGRSLALSCSDLSGVYRILNHENAPAFLESLESGPWNGNGHGDGETAPDGSYGVSRAIPETDSRSLPPPPSREEMAALFGKAVENLPKSPERRNLRAILREGRDSSLPVSLPDSGGLAEMAVREIARKNRPAP